MLKERNDKNFKAKNKKRKKLEDEVRVSNKERGGEERGKRRRRGEGKSSCAREEMGKNGGCFLF